MNIKKQSLNGVRWSTLTTIVLAFSTVLKISILTRFLGKEDFGLMAMVAFTMGFMDLFSDMGLTSAILHKQDISKKEYSSLYWLNLLISFFLFGLLYLITPYVAAFYNEAALNMLIPLLGLNLIFSGFGRQFKVREQKELSFKRISLIEIFSGCLSFVLAVILAVKGFEVLSLIYSALLQYFLVNFLYLFFGLKKYGILFHLKIEETKPFLRLGSFQVGGQVVNYFNRDLDILLIGRFFPAEILGGYSLAKQLVFRPAQILNPILVKVAAPALALYQNETSVLKQKYLKLINLIATINIPVYIGIIIFAPLIVTVLYGDGFENIVILVRILSVYMIFRALGNPVGSLVIATGRTDLEFYWNVIALLIMPVFIYIGSLYGIIEVSIAVTLAMILLFIPAWKFLTNKMLGISLQDYLTACFKLNFKPFFQTKFW